MKCAELEVFPGLSTWEAGSANLGTKANSCTCPNKKGTQINTMDISRGGIEMNENVRLKDTIDYGECSEKQWRRSRLKEEHKHMANHPSVNQIIPLNQLPYVTISV